MFVTLIFICLCPSSWADNTKPSTKGNDSGVYTPVGKRDPFKVMSLDAYSRNLASSSPSEKYGIDRFQLKAILRYPEDVRAMFEDPEGRSYILRQGDMLGRERGTLSTILQTEVIVTEKTFNYLGEESLYERVLSLPEESQVERGSMVAGAGGATPAVSGGGGSTDAKGAFQVNDAITQLKDAIKSASRSEAPAAAPAPAPAPAPVVGPNIGGGNMVK